MKHLPVAFLLVITLMVSICLTSAIVSVELSQTRPVLGFCYVNNTNHEVVVQFNLNNYTVPNLVVPDGPCWVELCALWKSCNGTSLVYVWPLVVFQGLTVILFIFCFKLIKSELDKQVIVEKGVNENTSLLNNQPLTLEKIITTCEKITNNYNNLVHDHNQLLKKYEELTKQ